MRGARKLLFGLAGLLFLAGGFVACVVYPEAGTAYPALATGVVTIVGLVVAGNVGAHAAQAKAASAAGLTREELEKRVAAALAASKSGGAS